MRELEIGRRYAPVRDIAAPFEGTFTKGEILRLQDRKYSPYDDADVYYFEDGSGAVREWWCFRETDGPATFFKSVDAL